MITDQADPKLMAIFKENKIRIIRYIDHGFYQISEETAINVCRLFGNRAGRKLPKVGFERMVKFNNLGFWITQVGYKQQRTVWAIHPARRNDD